MLLRWSDKVLSENITIVLGIYRFRFSHLAIDPPALGATLESQYLGSSAVRAQTKPMCLLAMLFFLLKVYKLVATVQGYCLVSLPDRLEKLALPRGAKL